MGLGVYDLGFRGLGFQGDLWHYVRCVGSRSVGRPQKVISGCSYTLNPRSVV